MESSGPEGCQLLHSHPRWPDVPRHAPPGLWAPEALVGRSPERPLFFSLFFFSFEILLTPTHNDAATAQMNGTNVGTRVVGANRRAGANEGTRIQQEEGRRYRNRSRTAGTARAGRAKGAGAVGGQEHPMLPGRGPGDRGLTQVPCTLAWYPSTHFLVTGTAAKMPRAGRLSRKTLQQQQHQPS